MVVHVVAMCICVAALASTVLLLKEDRTRQESRRQRAPRVGAVPLPLLLLPRYQHPCLQRGEARCLAPRP